MNAIAPATAPPRGPQFDNRRVLAGLIDVAIVAASAFLLGLVGGALGVDAEFTPAMRVVLLGWGLFYYFALESAAGQTLGKRLMGLRVTMVDGSHAGMRAIAVRTVLRVIDGFCVYLVGLIVMLVTGQRRQRLGDLAASTIVTSADVNPASTDVPSTSPGGPSQSSIAAAGPEAVAPGVDFFSPAASPAAPELRAFDPFTSPADAPEAPSEPVAEFTPPAVEAPAEPVVEDVAPAADAPDEPAAEVAPPADAPEPIIEIRSEPVESVETPDAPAGEAPDQEAANDWSFPMTQEAPDALEPELREQSAAETEVKVRSVETVSAIDLLMAEVEEDETAGSPPSA